MVFLEGWVMVGWRIMKAVELAKAYDPASFEDRIYRG
jgi:hypothetical protein